MQQTQRIKLFNNFADSIHPLLTEQTFNQISSTYCVREFKLKQIDATFAKHLYISVIAKQRKGSKKTFELGWIQNQLRLFVWTLAMYAKLENKDISQLTQEQFSFDWQFFSQIFPNKKKILFIYQGKNLLKKHNQYKKWVHEQDKIFESLVKLDNYRLKWSQLGKNLFIDSNQKYFRTPKQCRQRWLNHLDPSKLKKYWNQKEDYILIEYVKLYGKKWATISKKLNNKRNQHSIKNRFKSLLTKQIKQSRQNITQGELINIIYQKLKRSQPEKNQEIQISEISNQQLDDNIFEMESSQICLSEEQKGPQLIESNILNVITISNNHSKSKDCEIQKAKFTNETLKEDFLKSVKYNKQDKQIMETQIEKQIRADIFLQSDPFEMLKSYFYKKQR